MADHAGSNPQNNPQLSAQPNMDNDDGHGTQTAASDSLVTSDASQQLVTSIPVATYSLPSEVLLPILLAVPFSTEQHQIFKDLNPRIREMVESRAYRTQVARRNFPELCQLFHMYAPRTIVSEDMLLWFAQTALKIRKYTNVICQGFPRARKDIVRQGLYVMEAKRLLRSRLRTYPIPGHVRDIWDSLPDKYTAEVVRYTVWRVFQHLARLQDADAHFLLLFAQAETETPVRAILRGTFEACILYERGDHDGISVLSILRNHMYRTGPLMHNLRHVFTRLLALSIQCRNDPNIWAASGRAVLSHIWDGMQYYPKLTDIIETGEDEEIFIPGDSYENFWKRETDCVLSVVNKFENTRSPVGRIDFLAIGKMLRWEQQ